MENKFETMKWYWKVYYPIVIAFVSLVYSVSLWFTGNKLEGIFVGLWVSSILALAVVIRQRLLTTPRPTSKEETDESE